MQAISLLLGGLFIANGVYYQAYTLTNIIKPLATIFLAWLTYGLIVQRVVIKLPRVAEQFEHLIGVMSLILILVFWLLLGNQISISAVS